MTGLTADASGCDRPVRRCDGAAVVWLVPVRAAVMISVMPISQTRKGWWNFGVRASHFRTTTVRAWEEGLSAYALNSFIITICRLSVTVALGALAAYAFARLALPAQAARSYFLLITTMIVPVQIILVPLLPWFQTLGLTGSC